MWRFLDLIFSLLGILIFFPIFLVCAILILLDDGLPIFYKQSRVGLNGSLFFLLKFRTMYKNSHINGLITIGGRDPRITRTGYYLRKLKLDELPQLINVLKGEMSIIGPRPEVEKYVQLYPEEYAHLLKVKPGISSPASIAFSNENEMLTQFPDPEEHYSKVILPQKIHLDFTCVSDRSFKNYFSTIFKTLKKVVMGNK